MKGFLVFIVLVSSFTLCAKDQFAAQEFENPVREVSIIIGDDGFYPNRVLAYQGEKLRVFATTTSNSKQCFVLQKHDMFLAVEKGKLNEGEVLLEHPGRFKFYCPANKKFGHITVVEKESNVNDSSSREPASSKYDEPSYWIPRDYDEGF